MGPAKGGGYTSCRCLVVKNTLKFSKNLRTKRSLNARLGHSKDKTDCGLKPCAIPQKAVKKFVGLRAADPQWAIRRDCAMKAQPLECFSFSKLPYCAFWLISSSLPRSVFGCLVCFYSSLLGCSTWSKAFLGIPQRWRLISSCLTFLLVLHEIVNRFAFFVYLELCKPSNCRPWFLIMFIHISCLGFPHEGPDPLSYVLVQANPLVILVIYLACSKPVHCVCLITLGEPFTLFAYP